MIRKTTTLLTVGFLTLAGFSAMAAPAHHAKASLAAATDSAPAGDTKTEKTDKVEKKAKSTKGHASKDKGAAAEGAVAPTPAPGAGGEKMPEKK